MKKAVCFLIAIVLMFMASSCNKNNSPTSPVCDVVITFPDSNLESVIRDKINKATGDLCQSDCESITSLNAEWSGITDLTGIEYCVNLTELYLGGNTISDISALSGLTNLTDLRLWNNSVSDISALSGMTNLITLSLNRNSISDISALVTNCDAGGLGWGDEVYLRTNPLSTQATDVDIPYLESKGVDVEY